MSQNDASRLGQIVHLVDQAVHVSLKDKRDFVGAAEGVLFALRVALEDAGVEEPLAVMVAAAARYQKSCVP